MLIIGGGATNTHHWRPTRYTYTVAYALFAVTKAATKQPKAEPFTYTHTHRYSIAYKAKILECFYLADDVTYLFWFWSQNVRHTLNLIITMGFPQLHGLFRGFETIFWERRAGRRCRWRLFTIRFCSAILHTGLHCAGDQCCRWHVDLAGKCRAFRKSNFCK